MDSSATCNQCDFSFTGGHSHHAGGAMCICRVCLVEYFLPTESCWGARAGEVLELSRRSIRKVRKRGNWKKQKPMPIEIIATGTTVRVVDDSIEIDGETSHCVRYMLEEAACPGCGEAALVMGFEKKSACPRCKLGKLTVYEVEF